MSRRNVETYANDQQALCRQNDFIPDSLFREYGVNRGLRDVNGVGVLTGLTNISKIVSFQNVDGKRVPCEGQLFYRGYNIKNLIGSLGPNEFGFEKIAYLLLFGDLPDPQQLEEFTGILSDCRTLPTNFTRDVIMKAPLQGHHELHDPEASSPWPATTTRSMATWATPSASASG